jgi:hypothetical protein
MKVVIKTKVNEEIFQNVRVVDYEDGIIVMMGINNQGKVDTQVRRFEAQHFQLYIESEVEPKSILNDIEMAKFLRGEE